MPLSFGSGAALVDRLEALPSSGTPWKAIDIIPESGTPLDPSILFYRDPMDAIESLLQSPAFKDVLEFVPRKVWSDPEDENDTERRERNYKEIFSGKWSWRTQVTLFISLLSTNLTNGLLDRASHWRHLDPCHARV
jgi:hypothetical protein